MVPTLDSAGVPGRSVRGPHFHVISSAPWRATALRLHCALVQVYETEEWHAALDLRPAAVMRLVHIAVTKTAMDFGAMSTGTRIVHLIARIYMVAIVPVVGYVLYATVSVTHAAAATGRPAVGSAARMAGKSNSRTGCRCATRSRPLRTATARPRYPPRRAK